MTLEHKNQRLQELIGSLKRQSLEQKSGLWKRVAAELERPSQGHRVVNLSRIEKYAQDNDVIVVPGKLLSGGELTKNVVIIAYSYSRGVLSKARKARVLTIEEGMKTYPDAKNIKIIG